MQSQELPDCGYWWDHHDLAAVVEGEVLFERDGATIAGYNIGASRTHPVRGLGGDSELAYQKGTGIVIGPKRAGNPLCLGGDRLTTTDAAAALGLAKLGSEEAARQGFCGGVSTGLQWDVWLSKDRGLHHKVGSGS